MGRKINSINAIFLYNLAIRFLICLMKCCIDDSNHENFLKTEVFWGQKPIDKFLK